MIALPNQHQILRHCEHNPSPFEQPFENARHDPDQVLPALCIVLDALTPITMMGHSYSREAIIQASRQRDTRLIKAGQQILSDVAQSDGDENREVSLLKFTGSAVCVLRMSRGVSLSEIQSSRRFHARPCRRRCCLVFSDTTTAAALPSPSARRSSDD